MDVLVDGGCRSAARTRDGEQRLVVELPGRPVEVEIWLPHSGVIGVRGLTFDGAAEPLAPTGPRWITYGSSITQCTGGLRGRRRRGLPWLAEAWVGFSRARVRRAPLDPVAARTIRDTPARLISMCLGINIYGSETYSGRTLPGAGRGRANCPRHPKPRSS